MTPIPRPANWPPFTRDPTARDWVEDASDEDNGSYGHVCCGCNLDFIGHKRRPNVCKVCHDADEAEAKRRAEWLDAHNAPKDWAILTQGEVAQMKAELVQLVWSESELKRALEETRAAYTTLRQLVEAYQMVHDVDVDWDDYPKETLAMAHQEIDRLRAALEDISTTAHCLAKAGPLNTPTLDAAWGHFLDIDRKATNALAAARQVPKPLRSS